MFSGFTFAAAKVQKKIDMRKYFYILLSIFLVSLTGCEGGGSASVPSSVAKLSVFYFAANDSNPGLAQAVFTIEERLDTGLVWNKDSMLFGTRLDSVVPKFSFAATPSAAYLHMKDTFIALSGYDTLDFNVRPIYLTIRSGDRSTIKTYEIRATVHQADPDLYTWDVLTPQIYEIEDSEQQVVELDDSFVLIKSNGFALRAYQSEDGAEWFDLGNPTGLPAGTKVRQMISDGKTLYYGQDNKIYTSTDAVTWTAHTVNYPVVTMLMYWNSLIWALVENNGYELAWWENEALALSGMRPQGSFPVSDFGTVVFQSASLRERAMIIGGFADNGESLNTRWNLEYSTHPMPKGEYRMEEFSIDRPQFTRLTGISVIWYNNQLLMFGGVDEKMSYLGREILISEDEGLNWVKADSTKNQLPEVYRARQKQTAIVRGNYIYLFGGQDADISYSDVYRGYLNSIKWNSNN